MKSITKYIPATTIIISYFFACGILYLFGFWSTYNLDITNLISITEIPKSFFFPFLISQGYYIMNVVINLLSSYNSSDDDDYVHALEQSSKKNFFIILFEILFSLNYILVYAFLVILYLYVKYKMNTIYWMLSSTVLILLLTLKLNKLKEIKDLLPDPQPRLFILNILISVPLLSFSIGKVNSLMTYTNQQVRYIKILNNSNKKWETDSTCIKFVGFIGDKVVASSMDNKKIVFINQSSFEKIQISSDK